MGCLQSITSTLQFRVPHNLIQETQRFSRALTSKEQLLLVARIMKWLSNGFLRRKKERRPAYSKAIFETRNTT